LLNDLKWLQKNKSDPLRANVNLKLMGTKMLDDVPQIAAVMVWDALLQRCRKQVNRTQRCLCLTLDGVHLGDREAKTVSELSQ
jgi:hypothetical protein